MFYIRLSKRFKYIGIEIRMKENWTKKNLNMPNRRLHHNSGYVGAIRKCTCFLWDKENGLDCTFNVVIN